MVQDGQVKCSEHCDTNLDLVVHWVHKTYVRLVGKVSEPYLDRYYHQVFSDPYTNSNGTVSFYLPSNSEVVVLSSVEAYDSDRSVS